MRAFSYGRSGQSSRRRDQYLRSPPEPTAPASRRAVEAEKIPQHLPRGVTAVEVHRLDLVLPFLARIVSDIAVRNDPVEGVVIQSLMVDDALIRTQFVIQQRSHCGDGA